MTIYEIKSEGRDSSFRKKFTRNDALDSVEWRLTNGDTSITIVQREVTRKEYDLAQKGNVYEKFKD